MDLQTSTQLLNAVPIPCVAINRFDRIISANADALLLLGKNIVGRNYVTMLRQPALLDAVEETLQDGKPRVASYFANDGAQDTTYEVSVRAVEDIGPRGSLVVVLSFKDTTPVEQASQMRRDFVANVSHELRTPLTAVMGFIETLRGPAKSDPAAAERFLDIMQGEAERMNRLVGDLLSLSRVEGEGRVRPTTRIDLVETVDAAIRSISPLAQEAGVEIERDFESEIVMMTGDADQLMQVFTNLLENAIKYGGSGEKITVRLRVSAREAVLRSPGARVEVIDYGPGIDPVHLPRLTERFYRADDHRSRALGGTGLGLAIVKHIINRHRGRLRVASDLGKGACFLAILPVLPPS